MGNMNFLKQPMTAFLAPSKIEPTSVLPTLDWASEMSCSGNLVISGFSSRLETDVWDVLARGTSPIIAVKVCKKYKKIPPYYLPLLDSGRLLLVFLGIDKRLSRKSAHQRNKYVASLANEIVFPSINDSSSLFSIYQDAENKGKKVDIIR